MPTIFAVHHPLEPVLPDFDFWSWRLYRRLTIDRLIVLARAGIGTAAPLARGLEDESLEESAVTPMLDVFRTFGMAEARNTRDLFLATAELTERMGLPVEPLCPLPAILPAWDDIPMNRAIFIGNVNGVAVRARLAESMNLVPSYRIIWQLNGDEEPSADLTHNPAGLYLPFAKPLWDWLLARRLTVLSAAGRLPWPDSDRPPIVLDLPWDPPGRPM